MSQSSDNILMKEKLSLAIKECEQHIQWADVALHYIKNLFPLTAESYYNLRKSEEEFVSEFKLDNNYSKLENMKTGYFDQFLYRYTKLQDTIGANIVRTLAMWLEYNDRTLSFIDCLNILERHSVIESTKDFEKLRDIRNSITHDYSDNIDEQAFTLNNVYKAYNSLLVIFDNIKSIYSDA